MEFKIEGLEDLINTIDNANKLSQEESRKFLNKVGMRLKRKVVLRTPVDTGHLRRSWHYKTMNSNEGILSTNVHYAPLVEHGHRTRGGKGFVEGRYMLTKSVAEIEQELHEEAETMFNNLFK